MTLTPEERETILRFDDSGDACEVWTASHGCREAEARRSRRHPRAWRVARYVREAGHPDQGRPTPAMSAAGSG